MTELLTRSPEMHQPVHIDVQDVSHVQDVEVVALQTTAMIEEAAAKEQHNSAVETDKKPTDLLGDDERYKLTQMLGELSEDSIPDELKLKRDFNEGRKAHDEKQSKLIEDFKADAADALAKHEAAAARAKDSADYKQRIKDHNDNLKAEKAAAAEHQDLIDKELYKVKLQIGEKRLNADLKKYQSEASAKVDAKLGIVRETNEGPTVTEQRKAKAEADQSDYAAMLKNHDKAVAAGATSAREKQLLKDVKWSEMNEDEAYASPELKAIDQQMVEAENKLLKAKALGDKTAQAEAQAELDGLYEAEDKAEVAAAQAAEIASLEAQKAELEAARDKLKAEQTEAEPEVESAPEVAEVEPVVDTSKKGLRARLGKMLTNANLELGKFRADPKEYFALNNEGIGRRRKLAATVLGGAAVITAAVLISKNMMSGEEVTSLASGTESTAPAGGSGKLLGAEMPLGTGTEQLDALKPATTPSVETVAVRHGGNIWSMAEEHLRQNGNANPSLFEIDALKDKLLEDNDLTEATAKKLKPGTKISFRG